MSIILGDIQGGLKVGDYCDRREQLAQLKIPAVVIRGKYDPIVPLEVGKEVAPAIPEAEFCIINGMGHDISLGFANDISDYIVNNARQSRY